jgi:hypothetical protein
MSKKNKGLEKEIRLNCENVSVRAEGEDESEKMIVEGYPIVFGKEAYIEGWDGGFYEKVDRHAFDNADMKDVALKYNHNDNVFIMARTKNGSLTLTPDDHGVFMHAELIDTDTNKDVYKMVKSGLLTEGSFAFTVEKQSITEVGEWGTPNYEMHRTIEGVGTLFDVSICPNGAYGNLTEIYARSYEALESVKRNKTEVLRRVAILKLKNRNKMLIGGKKQ